MRSNLIIEHFTYTGDGADNRLVSLPASLTLKKPQLVIVKGGANVACFKTILMKHDESGYLAGNTAHFAGGIKEIYHGGIRLGTDAKANANGTVYYGVAIWGDDSQNYFRVFKYLGSGADNRDFTAGGLYMTPDFVFTKGNRADNGVFKSNVISGDSASHFSGTADAANEIQSLIANGFQLGTSSRANSSGSVYDGFVLKELPGAIEFSSYVGNGVNGRDISLFGFDPDIYIGKNSVTTNAGYFKTSDFAAGYSATLASSAPAVSLINTFITGGVNVSSNDGVNKNGDTYWAIGLKSGSYAVPITRTSV
jgi:hypothetical protein